MGDWIRLEQVLERIPSGKLAFDDGSLAAGGMVHIAYNRRCVGVGVFRVALKIPLEGAVETGEVVRGEITLNYLQELASQGVVQQNNGRVYFTDQARQSLYFLELYKSLSHRKK
ncbi:hypothetical protein HY489_03080 [Candidatus Woesearchaeota archaeon]|nr:hypothetical protein [Candidatus Woesearchaeota archaeon]